MRAGLVAAVGVVTAAVPILVAAPAALASSAVVYVAQGGNDAGGANTCASAISPCSSVTQALSEVTSGGTIYVAGTISVYDNSVNPGDARGINIAQNVTIAQQPGGASAVLEGTGSVAATGSLLAISGAFVVDVEGLTFLGGNSSASHGGAISNSSGGTVTISDCDFADNHSIGGYGDGGAIDNADNHGTGTLTVADSTFSRNAADSDGGAIDNADNGGTGTVTVHDSTFSHNDANGYDGGAIDNADSGGSGTLTVDGSTFDHNQAGHNDGGAIDNADYGGTGTARIQDSTFADNESGDGGAIDNNDKDNGVGTLTVVADLFSGDVAGASGDELDNGYTDGIGAVYTAADVFDGSCYENISGWSDGGYEAGTSASCLGPTPAVSDAPVSSAIGADLGSLSANGGPTSTILPLAGNPLLGLIPPGAPIVTLNGTGYQLCPTTDQRGIASASGTACNPGSVQDVGSAPLTVTVSGTQVYGSSASFTYTTSPPGITIANLECTTVDTATQIGGSLATGSYTIVGSSCSGTVPRGDAPHFVGASSGFVVSPAPSTGSQPSPSSPLTPPIVTMTALRSSASPAAGTVTVTISCQQAACSGMVRLTVARRFKRAIRQLVLAAARYSARAGGNTRVALGVTKNGRLILPRSDGRTRWRATATVAVAGGTTSRHRVYVEWAKRR